ncbi:MAG TPA: DUF302 domain-containing protein [Bryobacteraceae bacterium]|nr:DUF302 domain-containing protein [Bryobacteraceae bacterium]
MATRQISIQRSIVTSVKPFDSVVAALNAAVGHPDMNEFATKIADAKTYDEMERIIQPMLGKCGLMEFIHFDVGMVLARTKGPGAPKSLRLVIGNPLTMQAMVRHVPDAASYAPVTVLIDERPGGVQLSYDTMASLLAPYGNAEALRVARELDDKVGQLIAEAAGS